MQQRRLSIPQLPVNVGKIAERPSFAPLSFNSAEFPHYYYVTNHVDDTATKTEAMHFPPPRAAYEAANTSRFYVDGTGLIDFC